MRPIILRSLGAAALSLALPGFSAVASAWEMAGTKQITLRTRDGGTLRVGTVTFKPQGPGATFSLELDLTQFRDHFLSMREFKCLEGPELQCYIPYPYSNPKTVSANDLSWLEHSLMFFFKSPTDYGAKLSNGIYYAMRMTDEGITGSPQAVDLNDIASPPADLGTPPLAAAERTEMTPGSRWIEALDIR